MRLSLSLSLALTLGTLGVGSGCASGPAPSPGAPTSSGPAAALDAGISCRFEGIEDGESMLLLTPSGRGTAVTCIKVEIHADGMLVSERAGDVLEATTAGAWPLGSYRARLGDEEAAFVLDEDGRSGRYDEFAGTATLRAGEAPRRILCYAYPE